MTLSLDHPLLLWISDAGLTRSDAAASLGITPVHLSQIANGRRQPSLELLQRIIDLTEGAVGLSAFTQVETKE